MSVDLSFCRAQFPSLEVRAGDHPAAYFDGPGGTQTPQRVIDALVHYLARTNANSHGAFQTSVRSDAAIARSRRALADLLGAGSGGEIAFGNNMTTLNFALSRALARRLQPGDEIIVTELDHDANVAPWLALAEQGAVIRWARLDTDTCTVDLADLESKLSARTRILAIGLASNATGTVTDVARAAGLARSAGATVVIDAVHAAPHIPIDVSALGGDFLLCSVYKFFGPHVGVLWGRPDAFAALETYKVRPQSDDAPHKIETGTLNLEGIAASAEAVAFIADLGLRAGGGGTHPAPEGTPERRRQIRDGIAAIEAHESALLAELLDGLGRMPGLRVYGPPAGHPRTPTVSFTLDGRAPAEIAAALGGQGLFVWDGDFYARTVVDRLGLREGGGLVRIGLAPYNTAAEVARLVTAIGALA